MILLTHNKKPKKSEVYDILIGVKKSSTNALSVTELDSLLNYFAPSLPKIAKTVEQWVAKAAGTKDVRYYLNWLYVLDGTAYGTDGARMHRGATTLVDGFYDVKTLLPVGDQGKYPDVLRLINATWGVEQTFDTLKDGSTCFVKSLFCYQLGEGLSVQKRFIDEAVNGQTEFAFSVSGGNTVRIKTKLGEAIVMAVRS